MVILYGNFVLKCCMEIVYGKFVWKSCTGILYGNLDIGGTEKDFQWLGEPPGGNWGNRSELAVGTWLLSRCVRTL